MNRFLMLCVCIEIFLFFIQQSAVLLCVVVYTERPPLLSLPPDALRHVGRKEGGLQNFGDFKNVLFC
jgi:hypothetical protein